MIVDQQLHGYNHGHELLSGSIVLPARDQDLVDQLSDIAGPVAPGERIPPYITCYPLLSGSHYVVARTWHDREAPRAGCVRTRSLFIPMVDWVTAPDPAVFVKMATNAGPSLKARKLTAEHGPSLPLPGIKGEGMEIIEALFLEGSAPVVVFGFAYPELIALRIITSIWPSMRRRFTVSTFCKSPRLISKKSFDLQFSPLEARPRFADWKGRRVNGSREILSRHPWSKRIANEVLWAAHPSLSEIDKLGELNFDETGSEESLRLSLLWEDLASKAKSEPHAALGLLDIASTRKNRRAELVAGLAPILRASASTAARNMRPPEAWRFLRVLIDKLGVPAWRGIYSRSLKLVVTDLATTHPNDAVKAVSDFLDNGNDELLAEISAGLAKVHPFKLVDVGLAELGADHLLRLVISDPDMVARIMNEDYGVEASLALGIRNLPDASVSNVLKVMSRFVVGARHSLVLDALLERMGENYVLEEAGRIALLNNFSVREINNVLIKSARRVEGVFSLRKLVSSAERSIQSDEMLIDLLSAEVEDFSWVISCDSFDESRRADLLIELFELASASELRKVSVESSLIRNIATIIGRSRRGIDLLVDIVRGDFLSPPDLVHISFFLVSGAAFPQRVELAARGLEAAFCIKDLATFKAVAPLFLSLAVERVGAARIYLRALSRHLSSGLASRNISQLNDSEGSVRALFLRSPVALADAVRDRGALDLSYEASEAVGSLLWDSASLSGDSYLVAAAKLTEFVRTERGVAASAIIAASFPSVYNALKSPRAADLLSIFLPFAEWDRTKLARRELARSLLSSKWRARDVALAAARAGDADQILEIIAKSKGGMNAISSIASEIDSIPSPWREEVVSAISKFRR